MMYIYYVLATLKELLTHLLEAAVLQLRKTRFKCLGKKKTQHFKTLHCCTGPNSIGLQQKEVTHEYDETCLYQRTYSDILHQIPRLVQTGIASMNLC